MKNIFNNINTKESIARLLVVLLSISFYMLLNNIPAVTEFVNNILHIISPLIWAAIIAYLLHPLIKILENKLLGKFINRKIAHNISVFLALIAALIILALLIISIIPQLVSSFFILIGNMEAYFDSFKTTLMAWEVKYEFFDIDAESLVGSWSEVFDNITNWIIKNIGEILGASYKFGNSLFTFLLSIILSIYMLLDLDNLKNTFKRLFVSIFKEKYYNHFREIARRSNYMFLRFINGNLIDSLIVGVANFIFMTILGIPYTLLISTIVAVTNFIPTFGPFIGAIINVLIILMIKPIFALWFVIWTIVLQTIDGNLIKPLLFGDTTGLRPLWVLVAIIIGGRLLGIIGLLICIPIFAVMYGLAEEMISAKLQKKGCDNQGNKLL